MIFMLSATTRSRTSILLLMLLVMSSLSACAAAAPAAQAPAVPKTTLALPPLLPSATAAATATTVVIRSPTPIPTSRRLPTATASQQIANGDEVSVPILLYHHISDAQPGNRYYVSTETFREHMTALRKAGWTAITSAVLADMLRGHAPLPEKAVVITFDDGALDVYQNAFPVMKETGYPGVFFLISSALGSEGYVSAEQVKEMITAGWEVGSHSMTHTDLTQEGISLGMEMFQSAVQLETALDIPVQSFAYPFSAGNEQLYQMAPQFGYTNAACAGWNNRQSARNVFCLSRREIRPGMTAEDLLKLVAEP